MYKSESKNSTRVANDCMIYFLVHELDFIVRDRHDISPAMEPLVNAMLRLVKSDIPTDVMRRIERTKFLSRIQHEFADHGLCAFNVFKHLTENN